MDAGALLAGLLVGIVGAACAAADGALLSTVDEGRPGVEPHTAGPREAVHRALAIGRLAAQVVAGVLFAVALNFEARPPQAAAVLALGVALAIVLGAEALPRAIGDALGDRARRALEPITGPVRVLVAPLLAAGRWVEVLLQRAMPPREPQPADRVATAEQFRRVVQAEAAVPVPHRAILERVFSLGDTEVQEIMVPRVDIIGIERGTPWSEVLDRVRSSQHARLPVYDETLDHVIGILFAKDLLPGVVAGEEPPGGWETLVRPATFIPEGKPIDVQLRDFKASRSHIAIVVDEYGGTAGLVTIEDILEEIVGDIRDEYDREAPPIEVEEGCRFWVAGRVTLDDLADVVGHRFEGDDVTTVGGLVFQRLGHVPRAGEELTLDGFRVVVERVKRRRVDRVYLERLEQMAEREA